MTGDYEPSGLGWVREHVEQIMRTGTTRGVTMNGRPTVLMTYRGAKTGKIRKTPVMRVEHEGRYTAVASKGGESPLVAQSGGRLPRLCRLPAEDRPPDPSLRARTSMRAHLGALCG
jgi:hypothetical protein